jgi:membrane-bound lytic murein transglycosylase C
MKTYGVILLYALPFLVSAQTFEDFYRSQKEGLGAYSQTDEQKEFESWQQQQLQDYESYKKALQEEFKVFRQTLKTELANYQKSIGENWDDIEISEAKKWVEYSDDRKTKRVVDYDKNEIRIHVIERKGQDAMRVMEAELRDMLREKQATAFKREPVMSKVEQKLRKEQVVLKGTPSKQLVLSELFETPQPSKAEIDEKTEELLKKAQIKRGMAKKASTRREGTEAMVVTIPLPKERVSKKAEQYRDTVRQHSGKWDINEPLILAVIHTESAFNPMATSYVPAYGMMQIVPRYAGKEAAERLWGKPKLLSPSYLYDANKNIGVGTVYLNILYYQYFENVKDTDSRLFCSIAAYNTGIGNVARAFTGKRHLKKAIPIINSLTSQQVYDRLRKHLPYEETRDYVQRVSQRMKAYQDL